ncbi:ester cyclase [Algirhabdus cladophorae]|uniref:ester cyclase n=1 Tax=Algirhabdus cladophorae TaxID=3377108 RepID=UPI003B846481
MTLSVTAPFSRALYDVGPTSAADVAAVFEPDAVVRLGHPLGDMVGGEALWAQAYAPLIEAVPDIERRVSIQICGQDEDGATWVGMAGIYTGTPTLHWMDIPPMGRVMHMRYHEFFRIVDGKVVEMQGIWDIPAWIKQAGVWPMGPSLGQEWNVPWPATNDGIGPHDPERTEASRTIVIDMLMDMTRHPSQGGPEVMNLEKYWHSKMNWYGPAGIGTARGIEQFRKFHQIPFLSAMPDRGQYEDEIKHHFMAEGDYVGVTGWPNMMQTITGSGWMGIAPSGTKVALRSLDFWRIENGLIRENWVLVDLLDLYRQLGVDVMHRMRELA